MVMSGIKTIQKAVFVQVNDTDDLDQVELRNGWIWGKFWRKSQKKTLDNRLDMEYAGKRGVKDDF